MFSVFLWCLFPDAGIHPGYHISFTQPVWLSFSWPWQFLRPPCFIWLWRYLRNTDQVFCAMSLFWDLMCISLMITLGWCILGRKITKAKYHFYHILSRIHTMNMAYHWWYWTWSADWGDVCWDSPLRSYSLFFLSMSYSLKWSHICSPNLRSRELNSLLWGQSINVNYLEFCIKALSLLSHLLFILSLCHYGLMDTYNFGYDPMALLFILLLDLFLLWSLSLTKLL